MSLILSLEQSFGNKRLNKFGSNKMSISSVCTLLVYLHLVHAIFLLNHFSVYLTSRLNDQTYASNLQNWKQD